jgi:hypothetical protein
MTIYFKDLSETNLDVLCNHIDHTFMKNPRTKKYWNRFNCELYSESGCMEKNLCQWEANDRIKKPGNVSEEDSYFSDGFWINLYWFNSKGDIQNYMTYFMCRITRGEWKIVSVYEDTIKSSHKLSFEDTESLNNHILDRMLADGIPTYEGN